MLDHVVRRRLRLRESGVDIALLDWGGEGPLALLHHANGFCAALWDGVAKSMRHAFRLIALDARGHGDSTKLGARSENYRWGAIAGDLRGVAQQLLEETGHARIALGLGHSFGGTMLLAAAAEAPQLFERLALVDPVILPALNSETARSLSRGPELAQRARKRRQTWPTRSEARAFFAERELFADWEPRALDLYVAEGLRDAADGQVELKCSGPTEAAIFENGPTWDPFAFAPNVGVPVRFFRAIRGNFSREVYAELASKMPEASLEELPGGHLLPMEQPALVARAVMRFAGSGAQSLESAERGG